jgi:Asp-tRNA(Asn)/Glu-tRNA(Gln) amidotransferase A subunit family amidase
MTNDLWRLSGVEAVMEVAVGAHSASQIAEGQLERVQACDRQVGAFRVVDESGVRRRVKELDDRPAGPLAGLMVGVKDVIDTVDLPTGYGSELYVDHQPSADANVVRLLRDAGATVLGKTESTEFALFRPTRTRNPANLARTPGGSSSGSAAAVAAGMVPVALGTQTAGSVLRPAAYCGVYGYKPARGWTPTEGIWRLAEHLDTVGLFARRANDLALLYRVLAARARPGTGTVLPRSASAGSVAILSAQEWGSTEPSVADALRHVADRLADSGWRVHEMAMPSSWRHLPELHDTVMSVEVAKNMRRVLGSRVELVSEGVRAIVERGDQCAAQTYLSAFVALGEACAAVEGLSSVVDVILCPTALGVAPEGLEATGDPVMCRAATVLGLPAANLPYYRRSDGLPVGVQAVAPRSDDVAFLRDLSAMESHFTADEVAPIATGFDAVGSFDERELM